MIRLKQIWFSTRLFFHARSRDFEAWWRKHFAKVDDGEVYDALVFGEEPVGILTLMARTGYSYEDVHAALARMEVGDEPLVKGYIDATDETVWEKI